MGIKEKDLQTVESLQSGDKIRIVTGGGNSRNIDAGAVGGGMVVTAGFNQDDEITGIDKTYNELVGALENGIVPVMLIENSGGIAAYSLKMYGSDPSYMAGFTNELGDPTNYIFQASDPNTPMESPR